MSSKDSHTTVRGGITSISDISMLDFFPHLNKKLFIDLYKNLGNEQLHDIASIFSEAPYEYRRGWPDLTIWKNGIVNFCEVKSPGDNIHKSQKTIINKIMKPLKLNFKLIDVSE